MLLQGYFLLTGIYGWYYWLKRKQEKQAPVVKYQSKEMLVALFAIILLSVGLGSFLHHFTDTDVAYIDGTLASASFVAQFLLTRKVLQNWLIWFIADIIYVPLFIYKQFYLTAFLYAILVLLAWKGYVDWKRSWKTNN